VVSTRDDKFQVADCLHCGAADYLVKPLRRNELGTMWAHVWRRWVRAAGGGAPARRVAG
jgi:response regulator of citrate/malate metabolism